MAASLPYVDVFLSGHNLESLEELAGAVRWPDWSPPTAGRRATASSSVPEKGRRRGSGPPSSSGPPRACRPGWARPGRRPRRYVVERLPGVARQPEPQRGQHRRLLVGEPLRDLDLGQRLLGLSKKLLVLGHASQCLTASPFDEPHTYGKHGLAPLPSRASGFPFRRPAPVVSRAPRMIWTTHLWRRGSRALSYIGAPSRRAPSPSPANGRQLSARCRRRPPSRQTFVAELLVERKAYAGLRARHRPSRRPRAGTHRHVGAACGGGRSRAAPRIH